ncbi:phage head spike fiber domain-containing protein [Atlantibacter hermannii]|uniref:phage head spike fiber domain-containing protein n=1 Tax=Atlantibacter hermannii TaxID=565 RepID=UPI002FDB19E0
MSTIDIRRAAQYATVAENAAAQCVIVADNLQDNVEGLTEQATAAAQQAQSSQNAAKASETAAKSSETSASASASSAAQSAAEAASSAASTGYVAPPFPDVWAPLSDDLKMIAGYPVNTKMISFSRASTATYIDKSGVLQTAVVNEPRFEKEGLLIEGQATNYFLYSNNPSNWVGIDPTLNKTFGPMGSTQALTGSFVVGVAKFGAQIHQSAPLNLTVGQSITISCRVKGTVGMLRIRIAKAGAFYTAADVNLATGQVSTNASFPMQSQTLLESDGFYNVISTLDITSDDIYVAQLNLRESSSDINMAVGAGMDLQMPQIEIGKIKTSFIITDSSSVTRASDIAQIDTVNGGFDNVTIACTVTRLWQSTSPPNTAPRIFSTRGSVAGSAWDAAFNTAGAVNSFGGQTNAGALVSGFVDGQVFTSIKTPAGLTTMTPAGKTPGSQTTSPGFVSPLYLGNTKELNRPLFGHIRNLRIWHSVLSDIQIKGLR